MCVVVVVTDEVLVLINVISVDVILYPFFCSFCYFFGITLSRDVNVPKKKERKINSAIEM